MQSRSAGVKVAFMSINAVPWLLACVAAVWFGFLAVRSGKSWLLWALAGGLFGLVSSTCVIGLGQATGLPFSDHERSTLLTEWTVSAVAIILLVGGLFTWSCWGKSRAIISDGNPPGPIGRGGVEAPKR